MFMLRSLCLKQYQDKKLQKQHGKFKSISFHCLQLCVQKFGSQTFEKEICSANTVTILAPGVLLQFLIRNSKSFTTDTGEENLLQCLHFFVYFIHFLPRCGLNF